MSQLLKLSSREMASVVAALRPGDVIASDSAMWLTTMAISYISKPQALVFGPLWQAWERKGSLAPFLTSSGAVLPRPDMVMSKLEVAHIVAEDGHDHCMPVARERQARALGNLRPPGDHPSKMWKIR